ncbi:MAG: ribosome assembly cofactor RimP [Bacteroidota bacterium]
MIEKDNILELAQERIDELDKGLFIVELKISATNVIQLEIDALEGQVAIQDCVSVSRNIEHNLDREEQDFELQVSSAGLDQPFRVKEQYIKNCGEEVKVKLKEQGKIQGVLKRADDEGIVIQSTTKERLEGRKKKVTVEHEHAISYEDIKETKIVISFKKRKS